MDLCEHAFYKPEEKYMPYLYCNIDDKRCMYSKKCMKVERFVPLENEMWKECYKFIMNKKKNIPLDSYYVQTYRPNKNNKLILYVVIDEKVERIQSDLTELNQDYVYLQKDNNKYKISLTPIVDDIEVIDKQEINIDKQEVNVDTIKTSLKKRGRKSKSKNTKEIKEEI